MMEERYLIDKEKVYQRACRGCIRHGEAPGECYHDEPCGQLIFAFTTAEPVSAFTLPCKLGDEVWGLQKSKGVLTPKRGLVSSMFFVDDMKLCIVVNRICRGEWGKSVFATYEDACTAIRERREGE